MQRIHLTTDNKEHILEQLPKRGYLRWLGVEENHAIVRVKLGLGFSCMLHIYPAMQGSIFTVCLKRKRVELVLESIIMTNGNITALVFVVG